MKSSLFKLYLAFLSILLVSCFGTKLSVPIEKGKIDGDFSLSLTDKNIIIKPNEFFKLSDLNLKANGGHMPIGKLAKITEINAVAKMFKTNKVKNYPITITKPGYSKPYYGKIAFFKGSSNNEADAVTRYYEIDIANNYFNNATRGRMAIIYEYSNKKIMGQNGAKIPTWMILMSDEPF